MGVSAAVDNEPRATALACRLAGLKRLAGGQSFDDAQLEPVVVFDGESQRRYVPDRPATEMLAAGRDAAHLHQGLCDAGRTRATPRRDRRAAAARRDAVPGSSPPRPTGRRESRTAKKCRPPCRMKRPRSPEIGRAS